MTIESMKTATKNVVVVMQQENWEDDGGDHDPVLFQVSDKDFDFLETLRQQVSDSATVDQVFSIGRDAVNSILTMMQASPDVRAPCMVDAMFNFWYT